jgi:origin recognition complex subunit 1
MSTYAPTLHLHSTRVTEMPPKRKSRSNAERARRWLSSGRVARDDSDDELGYDDLPWEWIYAQDDSDSTLQVSKKRKREPDDRIVGAQMGSFKCRVGDTVLLKAADNQAWVGIICEFGDDEDGEKSANFMWLSSPAEIRNKQKKKTDFFWVGLIRSWKSLTVVE